MIRTAIYEVDVVSQIGVKKRVVYASMRKFPLHQLLRSEFVLRLC
jgi:hypothetical protein